MFPSIKGEAERKNPRERIREKESEVKKPRERVLDLRIKRRVKVIKFYKNRKHVLILHFSHFHKKKR